MASLQQLIYQLPKQSKSADLSTLHSLSQQGKASSGRYSRVPSLISKYHGAAGVGNFSAAPMQNAASGGNVDIAPPPAPAPAPSSPPPVPGTDTSDMAQGFSIGTGTQGLADMMGQQIGNNLATSMAGRSATSAAQTGAMATMMGAPTNVTLDAMMNSGMLANLSLSSLKGIANAIAQGYSASQIEQAMNKSGIIGPNTAVDPNNEATPPMGTVASNVAMSSLNNSPQTALGLFANMFSNNPTATDITNDSLATAMHGLSQSTGVSKGSQDPVAQSLLNYNPQVLQNMMQQNMIQKTPIDLPTVPTTTENFTPMSLSFSDTPAPDDSGFTPMSLGDSVQGTPDSMDGFSPMSLGGDTPSSPDMGGFSPMGLGAVGTAPGGAGAGAAGSVGPAGTPGAAGMGGPAGGGDGGDGDGTVICTELHRQGLMPNNIYKADSEFGNSLDDDTIRGYHLWGKPVARAMKKSPLLTKLIKPLVLSWAYAMAGTGNSLFWRLALKIGVPVCRFIGKRLNESCTERIYE